MKINNLNKAEAYANGFDGKAASCFIFGPDNGSVSKLFETIARKIVVDANDPFMIVNLDNDKISEDPAIIIDELTSMSFGVGRKLVQIKNCDGGKEVTEAIISAIEQVEKIPDAGFLLISGADLPPTNAP